MKQADSSGPHMLSIKKVGDRLDVSDSSVRRLIKANELPAYRIGGQLRISEQDLETFIKARRHWPNT